MNGKNFWVGFAIFAVLLWMGIGYGARAIADRIENRPLEPVIVTQ